MNHGGRCKQGVRLAIITLEGADDGPLPVQQSESQGVPMPPVPVVFPYGSFGNPPSGTPAYEFMVLNQSENRWLLPMSWRKRPKNTPGGDSGIFSPETNTTEIRLKANGDVSITTDGNHVEIVDGDITITASGTITLDSDVTITGDLTVEGGSITAGAKEVGDSHTHGGVSAGGASTAVPD